jgi:hypothetical protein
LRVLAEFEVIDRQANGSVLSPRDNISPDMDLESAAALYTTVGGARIA